MSVKETLLDEISKLSDEDPILQELWNVLDTFLSKKHSKSKFKEDPQVSEPKRISRTFFACSLKKLLLFVFLLSCFLKLTESSIQKVFNAYFLVSIEPSKKSISAPSSMTKTPILKELKARIAILKKKQAAKNKAIAKKYLSEDSPYFLLRIKEAEELILRQYLLSESRPKFSGVFKLEFDPYFQEVLKKSKADSFQIFRGNSLKNSLFFPKSEQWKLNLTSKE